MRGTTPSTSAVSLGSLFVAFVPFVVKIPRNGVSAGGSRRRHRVAACARGFSGHEAGVMVPNVLRVEQWLPKRREEVFPFFADAHNLEAITPDWVHFQILTPAPIAMRVGLRIDYRLRIHGLPVSWQTEITAWEPPFRFVDEQRRGPYALWHHEHRFEERDGGTLCVDIVHYAARGGPLRTLVERLFVRADVQRIFDHRRERLAAIFTSGARAAAEVQL